MDAVSTAAAGADVAQSMSAVAQNGGIVSWSGYFQALAVLCLIIAALWAALWHLKRRGGLKALGLHSDMAVESRLALGPKKSIMVVRFLNKRLLLGVTDQQITLLTELDSHDEDAATQQMDAAQPASFKDVLRAATPEQREGER